MTFFNKEDFANFNLDEFLSFRKFISPIVIKILYLIGVVAIVLFGLYMFFMSFNLLRLSFGAFLLQFFGSILLIVFGNLSWRVGCEMMLLMFSMNDELKKLNNK